MSKVDWDEKLRSAQSLDVIFESLKHISTAAFMVDPRRAGSPILYVNDAFLELTGYTRSEVIGHNSDVLTNQGRRPTPATGSHKRARHAVPIFLTMQSFERDGIPIRFAAQLTPGFDINGRLICFRGQVDQSMAGTILRRRMKATEKLNKLTWRQGQVLMLIATGLQAKRIAVALGIAERTVKMHRTALLKKLGARSTANVVRMAVEAGL